MRNDAKYRIFIKSLQVKVLKESKNTIINVINLTGSRSYVRELRSRKFTSLCSLRSNCHNYHTFKALWRASRSNCEASPSGYSISSHSNWSLKAFLKIGITSATVTSMSSSSEMLVTPLPSMPHGTIWSNHLRSVLQLSARPWVVM